MIHGFLKVAVASPKVSVADCGENTAQILNCIKEAEKQNARIIVFPELCITGSTCGDLFLQELLGRIALSAVRLIAEKTNNLEITSIVGFPFNFQGARYNCAAVIYQGKVRAIIPKTTISSRERRYFTKPPKETVYINEGFFGPYQVPFGSNIIFIDERDESISFDVTIVHSMHSFTLTSALAASGFAVFNACLAAVPETAGSYTLRRNSVKESTWRNINACLFANAGCGESTSDTVFSGHSLITEYGTIIAETKPFNNEIICSEIDIGKLLYERRKLQAELKENFNIVNKTKIAIPLVAMGEQNMPETFSRTIDPLPFIPKTKEARNARCLEILTIQAQGLAQRLKHTGIQSVVFGLSGGLDSTLALLVAVYCFDILNRERKNILAITMPGFGTTRHTKTNGLKLARLLGVDTEEIKISRAVKQHLKNIGHDGETQDITYENAQARERTQILMDKANMSHALVLGTGNLSELALGWTTYNGDHMSMYALNASVPKTLVKEIIRWAQENPQFFTTEKKEQQALKSVLNSILDTPISPELLPPLDGTIQQKTEDCIGPYELHDFFIYHVIRYGCSPAKTLFLAEQAFSTKDKDSFNSRTVSQYSVEEISYWLKIFYTRFFTQQFKRSCMPDGPVTGSICFSPRGHWLMPSDAHLALWLKELETL